jgi:heme-degrading monooxygenase HmoA
MILEVAILDIKPGEWRAFESSFRDAEPILRKAKGYVSHEIQHSIEKPDRYILLVRWEKLENHTVDFRGSPLYQEWKELLHHFYSQFPVVEHFSSLATKS